MFAVASPAGAESVQAYTGGPRGCFARWRHRARRHHHRHRHRLGTWHPRGAPPWSRHRSPLPPVTPDSTGSFTVEFVSPAEPGAHTLTAVQVLDGGTAHPGHRVPPCTAADAATATPVTPAGAFLHRQRQRADCPARHRPAGRGCVGRAGGAQARHPERLIRPSRPVPDRGRGVAERRCTATLAPPGAGDGVYLVSDQPHLRRAGTLARLAIVAVSLALYRCRWARRVPPSPPVAVTRPPALRVTGLSTRPSTPPRRPARGRRGRLTRRRWPRCESTSTAATSPRCSASTTACSGRPAPRPASSGSWPGSSTARTASPASVDGDAATLDVVNRPVDGPLFSGPQQSPFVCTTSATGSVPPRTTAGPAPGSDRSTDRRTAGTLDLADPTTTPPMRLDRDEERPIGAVRDP